MRNWLVRVFRGDYEVALLSITSAEFLADLENWIARQTKYRLEIVERKT
jgi:hypothetical protein